MKIEESKTQNSKKSNRKISKFDRKISKFGNEKEPSHVERLQNADDFARCLNALPSPLCQALLDLQLYPKAFLAVGNIDMEVELLEISLYFPLIYIIYLLSPFISLSIQPLSCHRQACLTVSRRRL
jgi:hypothetical protein